MADAVRKAFSKLIRSGDMPKKRAEFLDAIETGGDTAKFAFIESLDKLDEKSRAAIGGLMRGAEEPWGNIADAAYGPEKARPSGIRGKNPNAKEEPVAERPGVSNAADKDTLPNPPAGKGGKGKQAAKPARGGKAEGKPPAGDKPAPRRGRGRPAGQGGAPADKNPLAPMTTPVGTFVPAAEFRGFPEAQPPAPPPQPPLGTVTYGASGLPKSDPTGSADLLPRYGEGDVFGFDTGTVPEADFAPTPEPADPLASLTPEQFRAVFGDTAMNIRPEPPKPDPLAAITPEQMMEVFGGSPAPQSALSGLVDEFGPEAGAASYSEPSARSPEQQYAVPNGSELAPFFGQEQMLSFERPGGSDASGASGAPPKTGPETQKPGPSAMSRAGEFIKKAWPWAVGGTIGGGILFGNRSGEQQGYQEDTSDAALEQARAALMRSQQALQGSAMPSGGGR